MAKVARSKVALALADKVDQAGVSVQALSREIAAYLLSVRRVNELDSILRDIQEIRAERGVVEVSAVTAHPLTKDGLADIEQQIRTLFSTTVGAPAIKHIIVSEVHDDELIGGVRLELANQQLDLSVRAKLNRFKQRTSAHGTF